MKALNDNVIIKPDKVESKTAGGIYIPDAAKEEATTGVVFSSGVDSFSKGDRVHFIKRTMYAIEHNGEQLAMIKADDILCVLH
jgi:chaperonin GroES